MGRSIRGSLLLLLLALSASAAAYKVDVRVSPAVGFAPLSVTVYVHASSHPADSSIVIIVDGPAYFAYSQYDLADGTAYLTAPQYRDLAAGDYTITARLVQWIGSGQDDYQVVGVGQANLKVAE